MMPQVILKATQGKFSGEEFVFTGKTTCLVGRAGDCSLCIPNDLTVSRYHCLLDIDAPLVWVEDLGSLNGTFVEGELIGRRDPACPADEIRPRVYWPRLLLEGDELRIGDNTFTVVLNETPCARISDESMPKKCLSGV